MGWTSDGFRMCFDWYSISAKSAGREAGMDRSRSIVKSGVISARGGSRGHPRHGCGVGPPAVSIQGPGSIDEAQTHGVSN
jgi:hypothetical protein